MEAIDDLLAAVFTWRWPMGMILFFGGLAGLVVLLTVSGTI